MLTRSGLGALVVAVVAAGLGWWWGYEELVVIGAALLGFILLAVWIAQRPLRATVVRRVNTVRVPRGDPIRVSYRVRNDTRYRSARFTLIDRCDRHVTETPVDQVDSQRVADVHAAIDTHRRGVFPVGPLDLQRIDPFYLSVGRRRVAEPRRLPTTVTVHPRVYDLYGPEGAMRSVENESVIRRAATDPMSGFVSMREYVPGDDPRMIHWPTTARTGTLMVREHVEVRRPEFTVVLDTAADAADPDDFEEAVDVVATVAVHAIRSGRSIVVRTTSRPDPGLPTPLVTEAQVLELLTPVQQTEGDDLLGVAGLFDRGFDHTSVLMVTGPSGPSSEVMTVDRTTTVRIGRDATTGTGVAFAAADAVEFVQRWRIWS